MNIKIYHTNVTSYTNVTNQTQKISKKFYSKSAGSLCTSDDKTIDFLLFFFKKSNVVVAFLSPWGCSTNSTTNKASNPTKVTRNPTLCQGVRNNSGKYFSTSRARFAKKPLGLVR